MAKDYIEPNKSVISRTSSIAHQIFRSISRVATLLVFGLFVSIAVELFTVTFIAPERGAQKSREMLEQELVYVSGISEKNPFINGADEGVYSQLAVVNELMVSYGFGWLATRFQGIAMHLEIVMNMVNVFCLRVCVMLFSFPIYAFCGIIGISRGLVNRELRKWGGGRESSGKFHLWMNMVPFGFVGSWILYLSWPGSLNPNYVVMPFALFFGWMLMLTAYRMKKYL